MRADDSVHGETRGSVELAAPVLAGHGFVDEGPEDQAEGAIVLADQTPIVESARPGPAVVEPVERFRGEHQGAFRRCQLGGELVVGGVVLGVDPAVGAAGEEHGAALRVERLDALGNHGVAASLVAVRPQDHGWVVDVSGHQLKGLLEAELGVVCVVPAGQLVDDVETEAIAGLEEVRIRRVMSGAHGVEVHRPDEPHVALADRRCGGPARAGPERVSADALELHPSAVDEEAGPGAELDRPKSEALLDPVEGPVAGPEGGAEGVQVRRLGAPRTRARKMPPKSRRALLGREGSRDGRAEGSAVGIEHLECEAPARTSGADLDACAQLSVRAGVDPQTLDGLARACLEVDGAVDTAECPIVGVALGAIDRRVGRMLANRDLEPVLRAEQDQVGHVAGETVETASMDGPRGATVDPNLGVRHRSFEDQQDASVMPRFRNHEAVPVGGRLHAHAVVLAVVEAPEAGHFPVARHRNGPSGSAPGAAHALEVPGDRFSGVSAGEIEAFRGRSRGGGERGLLHARRRGEDQRDHRAQQEVRHGEGRGVEADFSSRKTLSKGRPGGAVDTPPSQTYTPIPPSSQRFRGTRPVSNGGYRRRPDSKL